MEREDLRQIAREVYRCRLVFLDEESIAENALVLEPVDGRWSVYRTGERAGPCGGATTFDTESEALDHAVERMRLHAKSRRAIEAAKKRRRLPPARPALKKLTAVVGELRAFMLRYDVRLLQHGVQRLEEIAASDEAPVDVMLAARAAYDRFRTFPPRDGWSEAYVGDANGGVDRRATAELERLKARLTRVLEPWTVEQ